MNTNLDDEGDEPSNINEFLRRHEHLFVIAGVFGAFGTYLANLQSTLPIEEQRFFQLGVLASFLLALLTSVLIVFYGTLYFTTFEPQSQFGIVNKIGKYSFITIFGMSFYFVFAGILAALTSLKGALLYFLGVVMVFLMMGVALTPVVVYFYLFDEPRKPIRELLGLMVYFGVVIVILIFLVGLASRQYGVDPGQVGQLDPYGSLWLNIVGVVSFSSLFGILVLGTMEVLFLFALTFKLVSWGLEQRWG